MDISLWKNQNTQNLAFWSFDVNLKKELASYLDKNEKYSFVEGEIIPDSLWEKLAVAYRDGEARLWGAPLTASLLNEIAGVYDA